MATAMHIQEDEHALRKDEHKEQKRRNRKEEEFRDRQQKLDKFKTLASVVTGIFSPSGTAGLIQKGADLAANTAIAREKLALEAARLGRNDFAWYNRFPDAVKASCSYSFQLPQGTLMSFTDSNNINSFRGGTIMAMDLLPTIGTSGTTRSYVNTTVDRLFSRVRQGLSGSATYEKTDLYMYLEAIFQIGSAITHAARGIGLFRWNSPYDVTKGRDLVRASGIDPSSIEGREFDVVGDINACIRELSTYSLPPDIAMYARRLMVYRTAYIDADAKKANFYLYRPSGFHRLEEVTDSAGNTRFRLCWTPYGKSYNYASQNVSATEEVAIWTAPTITMQTLIGHIRAMLRKLQDSVAIQTMKAEIQNKIKDYISPLLEIPLEYKLEPEYDPLVLQQMDNARVLIPTNADLVTGGLFDIYQASGTEGSFLKFEPSFVAQANITNMINESRPGIKVPHLNPALQFDHDPSIEEVMECSRLMYAYESSNSDAGNGDFRTLVVPTTCGADIALIRRVWYIVGPTQAPSYTYVAVQDCNIIDPATVTPSFLGNFMREQSVMNSFDYEGWRVTGITQNGGNDYAYAGVHRTAEFMKVFKEEEMTSMHSTAFESLLYVAPGNN